MKDFYDNVTQGPWFDKSNSPKEKAGGHSLSEAKKSRFHGLVKMRSEDKKECKCPFKGQR